MALVKICGARRPEDVDACVDAGVDYIGFNFCPASKRYVEPSVAATLVARLPDDGPVPVGVFADQTANTIMRVSRAAGVRVVQLHGAEPAAFCAAIGGFDVWKALVGDDLSAARLSAYAMFCDALLIDGRTPGSGAGWHYGQLARFLGDGHFDGLPVWVAGGLDADNVAFALEASGASGADVASGVERVGSAGSEIDPAAVAAFVRGARSSGARPDQGRGQ